MSAARALVPALCMALVLGACATVDEPKATPEPKESPPPAPKPAAAAPAPKPKPPPPPEPAPAPEPPKPVTRSLGQDELAKGVRSYDDGDYEAAAKQLQAALDLGLAAPSERVIAHKHLAFMACVGKRTRTCRSEFRNAFAADPAFDLAPAEAGHPTWGPVFRSVKAEVKRAAKPKPSAKTKSGASPKR